MSALSKILKRVATQARTELRAPPKPPPPARSAPGDAFEAPVRRPTALSAEPAAMEVNTLRAARAQSVASRAPVPDAAAYQRFLEGADQVYREELKRPLLGENVDVAGVAAYGSRFLNEGWSLDQVRASVRQSPEWKEKHPGEAPGAGPAPGGPGRNAVTAPQLASATESLKQLYREELGREIDPSGLAHSTHDLLTNRTPVDAVREGLRASDEYKARTTPTEPTPTPTPGPGPVDPNPNPNLVKRTGRVRLDGNSFADDQGRFNALGTTYMSALWQYQNDRPRLERTLGELKANGVDYIRALGVVGDVNNPDYWDGREIDWKAPGYKDAVAGLTDLAYDKFGLRVEWTLIGDGQKNIPNERDRFGLVDTFLEMSKGREEKIMHFEVANEAWQNGFSGDDGAEQLRRLTKYMNDRTDVLVASSAPDGWEATDVEKIYRGGVADLATYHFDRDTSKTEGNWRPVRQPWEWQYLGGNNGVPRVATNNEPIGPGASVASENDPMKLVSGAIVSHLSGLPGYVYHTNAGVRGDQEFSSMAGLDAFKAMKSYLPADLSSWSRKNAHWSDSPFKVYAKDDRGRLEADKMWPDLPGATGVVRSYGAVNGNEFFVYPMGIKGSVTMEPRRNVEFDVIHPLTGQVVDRKQVRAGEQFSLTGADAYVLKGRYV
ncbi:MAG: hypothetical protein JNJ54_24500 [Myxococcaceae bacterium]|nr:hypothetical protein [Myxococcaceae bacterium]